MAIGEKHHQAVTVAVAVGQGQGRLRQAVSLAHSIIAAAAFLAAPWQLAHAQAIVGSIPEEFRGDWCQESTKDNIFKPGGCKLELAR
jgi:hypothetical protein